MADSILVYFGFTLILAGLLSIIRPMRFLYIRTRLLAVVVAASGFIVAIVTLSLPVRTKQVAAASTRLDEWMPVWQFAERHAVRVDASPEKVFAAIRAVRADEILFFRTLIAIRRCGRPGPENILDAPETKPLLDVATQTTFVVLADESPQELVVGTVVAAPEKVCASGKLTPEVFGKTLPAGVALATMNYLVTPHQGGGSIVSTETRVYANGASAMHRFAVYWRIIHPGSDIIRRMWLRAIKRRAEGKVITDTNERSD